MFRTYFGKGCRLGYSRMTPLRGIVCAVILNCEIPSTAEAQLKVAKVFEAKYRQLGGSSGPLGRPTSGEITSKEGEGSHQNFEHGVIGHSPATGPNSFQVLYAKGFEMVFEWGDTSPFNYDFFIVRWDLNGKNVGQQDVKGGARTSGRWVTHPSLSGRYRLRVEGRDNNGKSRQGWSNSLYLNYTVPGLQGKIKPIATKP